MGNSNLSLSQLKILLDMIDITNIKGCDVEIVADLKATLRAMMQPHSNQ